MAQPDLFYISHIKSNQISVALRTSHFSEIHLVTAMLDKWFYTTIRKWESGEKTDT